MALAQLHLDTLKQEARLFLTKLSKTPIKDLYGITDGKKVGTHIEHAFHAHLAKKYTYERGSSASGIDFPALNVDLKVTSIQQPQSSCPYRDAAQKVYGLGYHLLVFVYEKTDNKTKKAANMRFLHAVFVDRSRTADYQTTRGMCDILDRDGNRDDIIAFLIERNLPLDEIGRDKLADRILKTRPKPGYLTMSNALQWRLQYTRIIDQAGKAAGIEDLLHA
jgi:restriction system protein